MRYLLDTHIFVWWMETNKKLTIDIKEIIEDPNNNISLSVVSIWELTIKNKLGKFKFPPNWQATLKESQLNILPVDLKHTFALDLLPLIHKDPFDRMLVAQAVAENCTLITTDPKITRYKVPTLG